MEERQLLHQHVYPNKKYQALLDMSLAFFHGYFFMSSEFQVEIV